MAPPIYDFKPIDLNTYSYNGNAQEIEIGNSMKLFKHILWQEIYSCILQKKKKKTGEKVQFINVFNFSFIAQSNSNKENNKDLGNKNWTKKFCQLQKMLKVE